MQEYHESERIAIFKSTCQTQTLNDIRDPVKLAHSHNTYWKNSEGAESVMDFPCHVKNSHIHGKGVFATRKILKGEVITQYPAHFVIQGDKVSDFIGSKKEECFTDVCKYAHNLPIEDLKIAGDPSIYCPKYAGHMINDALPMNHTINFHPTSIDDLGKSYIEYEIRVGKIRNCLIKNCSYYTYVIATKDIEEGEELLTSYGYPYWCELEANQIEIMFKLYVHGLTGAQRRWMQSLIQPFNLNEPQFYLKNEDFQRLMCYGKYLSRGTK